MNSTPSWIISLILSVGLIWIVWRPPWPGLPEGRTLKALLKVAVVWVFLYCAITLAFALFDINPETGTPKTVWRSITGASFFVTLFVLFIFFWGALRYEKLKKNPALPLVIESPNHEPITPLFLKHSLTFHNKLKKNVMVMVSRKADRDHPELEELTALQKDETKLVKDAVLAGQQFYTIKAKDVMATNSDRFVFSQEYTEEELSKLNWMVVIEPWL
jgi:hypothetical protein